MDRPGRHGQNHLLNALERQSVCTRELPKRIPALLTTKLLRDMVEVAAEDGHVGWLGPTVVGSDMPYPFGPGSRGGSSRGLA